MIRRCIPQLSEMSDPRDSLKEWSELVVCFPHQWKRVCSKVLSLPVSECASAESPSLLAPPVVCTACGELFSEKS